MPALSQRHGAWGWLDAARSRTRSSGRRWPWASTAPLLLQPPATIVLSHALHACKQLGIGCVRSPGSNGVAGHVRGSYTLCLQRSRVSTSSARGPAHGSVRTDAGPRLRRCRFEPRLPAGQLGALRNTRCGTERRDVSSGPDHFVSSLHRIGTDAISCSASETARTPHRTASWWSIARHRRTWLDIAPCVELEQCRPLESSGPRSYQCRWPQRSNGPRHYLITGALRV